MKNLILAISLIAILILSSCKTEVNKTCSSCNGSGTKIEKTTCDVCKGRGEKRCTYVTTHKYTWLFGGGSKDYKCDDGSFYDTRLDQRYECENCNGSGKVDCWKCNGYGTITEEKSCYSCGGDGRVKKEVWVWETW